MCVSVCPLLLLLLCVVWLHVIVELLTICYIWIATKKKKEIEKKQGSGERGGGGGGGGEEGGREGKARHETRSMRSRKNRNGNETERKERNTQSH